MTNIERAVAVYEDLRSRNIPPIEEDKAFALEQLGLHWDDMFPEEKECVTIFLGTVYDIWDVGAKETVLIDFLEDRCILDVLRNWYYDGGAVEEVLI